MPQKTQSQPKPPFPPPHQAGLITRAIAVLFAREGADVAIIHLLEEASDVRETQKAVKAEGQKSLAIHGGASDFAFCADATAA